MSTITFAHLSDLHILRDYTNSMFKDMIPNMEKKPEDVLAGISKWLGENIPKLDFVLLTGDLVHEGDAEEYRYLKMLLEHCFGDIPVYPVLGNHDRTAAFHEGYEGTDAGITPLCYTKEMDGLQVIVLDSSIGCGENKHSGQFDEGQFEFLEKALAKEMRRGHIIAFHHPAFDDKADPRVKAFGVAGAERLGEIIQGKNVLAVLSGHTHENINTTFYGVPAYTAESTAFGVALDEKGMYMTSAAGFNLCTV
ncbi:MAG: metallophosphoesterase, partial [Eubacterium sp.]